MCTIVKGNMTTNKSYTTVPGNIPATIPSKALNLPFVLASYEKKPNETYLDVAKYNRKV